MNKHRHTDKLMHPKNNNISDLKATFQEGVYLNISVLDKCECSIIICLQNFNLPTDILGVTHVRDLSDCDLEKIRRLSLLELTALYDGYQLVYHPLKKKKGAKG